MRFCLLGLALIAFAQPAAAHEKHRHHARHHLHHPRLAPDLDNAELPLVTEPVRMRRHHEEIDGELDAMIRRHAAANGLPPDLVRHVVRKESNFNPRASNRGALGLMQITHATARSLGYSGSAEGLYDPETNLTYAVRYLAGAYRTAGGSQTRAWAYYRSGYHRRGDTRFADVRPVAPDAPLPVKQVVVQEIHARPPVSREVAPRHAVKAAMVEMPTPKAVVVAPAPKIVVEAPAKAVVVETPAPKAIVEAPKAVVVETPIKKAVVVRDVAATDPAVKDQSRVVAATPAKAAVVETPAPKAVVEAPKAVVVETPVQKAVVVREVATDPAVKDQSRVVAGTPARAVEASIAVEPVATAETPRPAPRPRMAARTVEEAPLRAAVEPEPRVRVRHVYRSRHGRHGHEPEGGVLESLFKIAARGSVKPKHHAPLARAD